MKKYLLSIIIISLVILISLGFLYWQNKAKEKKSVINIEKTIVECKNGERYLGEDLVGKGLNFQLIESKIFYKGEELERLCNSNLREYSYEAEPSFRIIPTY